MQVTPPHNSCTNNIVISDVAQMNILAEPTGDKVRLYGTTPQNTVLCM